MLANKEYKDSGVSWLGNIPALWNIVKTKRHFKNEKRVAGKYANQYERLALTMNGVIKRDKEDAEGLQPESFEGYQVLEQNQLVFKLIDLENVKTSRVGWSPYTGIVSPAYIILHNDQQDNRFYYYYYMNMYYQEIFNYLGGEGVRSALNAKDLLETPIPDISLKQQKVIADYLDKECARIDDIVEKQRNIIEKLKEYKKSVIIEAVTKGLNPAAKMKDSGIEWIGKIPSHWETRKIKYIFEIIGGNGFPDEIQGLESGEFPFCKCSDINSSDIYLDKAKNYVENDIVTKYKLNIIPKHSILMSKIGEALKKNHRKINIVKCIVDNNMEALSPICTDYKILYLYFLTTVIDMMWFDNAGTIPSVNNNKLRNFMVCFPPLLEQQAIADYLDQKCAEIDSVIGKREKMIELLTEYKKSLIYECVTGKKEVA